MLACVHSALKVSNHGLHLLQVIPANSDLIIMVDSLGAASFGRACRRIVDMVPWFRPWALITRTRVVNQILVRRSWSTIDGELGLTIRLGAVNWWLAHLDSTSRLPELRAILKAVEI